MKGRNLSQSSAAMLFGVIAVVAIAVDRLTKFYAANALASGKIDIIPDVFSLRLVYNEGASFGMLGGHQWLFIVISIVVAIAIVIYLLKISSRTKYEVSLLALLFSGALGNAVDRIASGAVTDFLSIEFFKFPVFNIADCFITISIILLVIFILFNENSAFNESEE